MTSTTLTRSLFAARPRSGPLFDAALTAAVFAVSLMQLAHGGGPPARYEPGPVGVYGVVLVLCASLPLLGWRRFPLGAFAATAAADVLLALAGHPIDLLPGPIAALYLLAATRGPGAPWTRTMTVTAGGLLTAYVAAVVVGRETGPHALELLHTGLAWATAWFAGERTRLRREHVAELTERARRAERDAERERLLATAEERARIARDLHDSAGHAISVIAVRAGAARLRHDREPERSLAALTDIEDLARETAGEIDHIVGTLRDSGQDDGVPIGLASLGTLLARHKAAGLRVTLTTAGEVRPLSTSADQAAYRILQESLTNAARHGTGTVQIGLDYAADALGLTAVNPVSRTDTRAAGGHGLTGMRERAALLNGHVTIEDTGGAFRVHARIPYGGRRP